MKKFEIQAYEPDMHGELDHLCAQTQENGVQMLPVTKEKVKAQMKRFVAVTHNDYPVGYCAQTAQYIDGIVEVGSLIVDEAYRRRGVSKLLVKAVTKAIILDGMKPIAFCNPISKGLFEAANYHPMPLCDVPTPALELCSGCPKQPAQGGCCDKIYVYKGDLHE